MQGLFDSADPKGNFNPGKIIAAPGLDQGNSGHALRRDVPVKKSAPVRSSAGATKSKVGAGS